METHNNPKPNVTHEFKQTPTSNPKSPQNPEIPTQGVWEAGTPGKSKLLKVGVVLLARSTYGTTCHNTQRLSDLFVKTQKTWSFDNFALEIRRSLVRSRFCYKEDTTAALAGLDKELFKKNIHNEQSGQMTSLTCILVRLQRSVHWDGLKAEL